MHIFSNILGIFVFDDNLELADKVLFNRLEDYRNKDEFLEKFREKYKDAKPPDEKNLRGILLYFKNREFFHSFYSKNIELTKFDLKNSVSSDVLIIQSIKSIKEIDKAVNILVKRLREWYELYNPEFSVGLKSHESFVEQILEKNKNELLEQIKIKISDSFGADLGQEDLEPIRNLAQQIFDLYQLRKNLIEYISASMEMLCPNLKCVCDAVLGAKLIEHAGSLKRLSEMPASTIQIIGAEQALFRHMKTGSRPPRHGIILHHILLFNAPDRMHGKIARSIADKISIAAKVDYFQGQFIGDKLRKSLDEKFGRNGNQTT